MKIFLPFAFLFLQLISIFAVSAECPVGQHWVKAHNRKSYFRADGTFIKATSVSAHCRTNRESDSYWQNNFENNRPADWPRSVEKSKHWTIEEIERVLEAICELPEEIWKKSKYRMHRMERSVDGNNPATSANDILVIYDSAFDQKNFLSRVLAHEFAHEIYLNLKGSEALDYRLTTNWFELNKDGKRLLVSRKDGFVADDGRVSPEEDFANNMEFFLFDPVKLKSQTPHAYRWISGVYGANLKIRKCGK